MHDKHVLIHAEYCLEQRKYFWKYVNFIYRVIDPQFHAHRPSLFCGIWMWMLAAMAKVRTKVSPLVMAWKQRYVIKSQRKLEILSFFIASQKLW